MKLLLDRSDLQPQYQDTLSCSLVKYEHFNQQTQQAVDTVGYAVFEEFDSSKHNPISHNIIRPSPTPIQPNDTASQG